MREKSCVDLDTDKLQNQYLIKLISALLKNTAQKLREHRPKIVSSKVLDTFKKN